MTDPKKHDMRDGIPKATITNTNSRMAGGADNPNVASKDDNQILSPGPSSPVPDGQDTKSS
ncbi:MAG: hypothetical protein P4M15_10725 [Alphaproteobacteria bacterium]|nr:hypothetical protein [Alphaproteobacteria bacterium]